jgi:hypothetical protein
MPVYVLHLKGPAAVSRAFECLMTSSRIGSCLVEREHNRVRFLAPRKLADAIVERIYLEGELVWCSRHGLAPPEGQRIDVWPVDPPAAGADCE